MENTENASFFAYNNKLLLCWGSLQLLSCILFHSKTLPSWMIGTVWLQQRFIPLMSSCKIWWDLKGPPHMDWLLVRVLVSIHLSNNEFLIYFCNCLILVSVSFLDIGFGDYCIGINKENKNFRDNLSNCTRLIQNLAGNKNIWK